ncbi:MAG: hypothetical protein QM820_08080 [Minicystis sp.]
MIGRSSFLSSAALLCALGSSACAASSIDLRPSAVPADKGALFGRIEVTNRGDGTLGPCYVTFNGMDEKRRSVRKLDRTGWVFTTLDLGPNHLTQVTCGRGSLQSGDYVIYVPGHGRMAYFGDVRVVMNFSDPSTGASTAGFLIGGALGGAIVAAAAADEKPPGTPDLTVANRFQKAVAEYEARFGAEAQAIKPELAMLADVNTIPTTPPPVAAVGFPLGQDATSAEARCTGAAFGWKAIKEGEYSCSGAGVDLEMPATVGIRTCAGAICEVTVDAGADGAAWKTLALRYGKLVQRLKGELGDKHKRSMRALDGCAKGISDCFAAGRVRTSLLWRWPDRQRVLLVLDGGPAGGTPSLRVVYETAAVPEEEGTEGR